ncbi:MAG: glycosyltransferase [Phycisphaerae bacterium]
MLPADALHVLFVADSAILDRFAPMIRHLGLALSEADVSVSLITDDAQAPHEFAGTPIDARRVPALTGWRGAWLGSEITSRIENPAGLVHLCGTSALAAVGRWCATIGLPLAVHVFSEEDVAAVVRSPPRVNYLILAAGERLAALLRRHAIAPPGGVHLSAPVQLASEAAPTNAPPTDHTLGVLLTESDEPAGGARLLLDAVAQARARGVELQAGFVGHGARQHRAWQEARRRGLQELTSFVDAPRLWPQLLTGFDALVVATRSARIELAPLMAMAIGKLVIASRDQADEWFIDGVTARLFAPGDPRGLADELVRAAARDDQNAALRQSAQAYVRRSHAVSACAHRLCGVYRAISHPPAAAVWSTA